MLNAVRKPGNGRLQASCSNGCFLHLSWPRNTIANDARFVLCGVSLSYGDQQPSIIFQKHGTLAPYVYLHVLSVNKNYFHARERK